MMSQFLKTAPKELIEENYTPSSRQQRASELVETSKFLDVNLIIKSEPVEEDDSPCPTLDDLNLQQVPHTGTKLR